MIDPNAPAYPTIKNGMRGSIYSSGGLTIRAEIASRVLQGWVANSNLAEEIGKKFKTDNVDEFYAAISVKMADALIAELNKGGT